MSIIQEISSTDESALKAWAADYRLHWELEKERVKGLPEFQEWAATVVTADKQTDDGWVPGWSVDDCARKWVETYGFDFPQPPIATPAWADPAYTFEANSGNETQIRAQGEIVLSEGRIAKLSEYVWVYPDEKVCRDVMVYLRGFDEDVAVASHDIDDVIAALFAARHAITGTNLE